MRTEIDASYLSQRADAELRLASQARHPKAIGAHRTLALMYLNLAECKSAKRQQPALSN